MQTLILGDTHGSPTWRRVVVDNSWDQVVFVGDYFDDFTVAGVDQLSNFTEIHAFKRHHGDAVTLLVGNHDYHYLPAAAGTDRYSGYQFVLAGAIREALLEAARDLQMATMVGDYLVTHAGVTTNWLAEQQVAVQAGEDLAGALNRVWTRHPRAFKFYPGDHSDCGAHPRQGPLWVRPDVLRRHMAVPQQIVGHTRVARIVLGEPLLCIDAIPKGQFLLHTPEGFRVGQCS